MNFKDFFVDENILITQIKNKDELFKLFVLNLEFSGVELENSEKTVLFLIISNMNFKNIVNISIDFRSEIIYKSKLHRNTVSKAIISLEDKKIIFRLNSDELIKEYDVFSKNAYLVNSDVIGRGIFRDLKNLRQTVVIDYDFETLQIKKKVVREAVYN